MSPEITPLLQQPSNPELLLPDEHHLELKDHLESGNIPPDTSLGQAAIKELAKVGLEINLPPSANDEEEKKARVEHILDVLENNNSEDKTVLGLEDAMTLIESGRGDNVILDVIFNIDKFQGLNHADIANRLIESGKGSSVARYLDKFQDLNHVDIANRLIESGQEEAVASHLYNFPDLGADTANKLIGSGNAGFVANHLDRFPDLGADMVNKLIESGQGGSVAYHLDKFHGLDRVDIANKLIESGQGGSVAYHLDKFHGLDHVDIANRLIESGQGESVAYNLNSLQDLNHVDIANRLIESGQGKYVAYSLDKFQGLGTDIANKLIESSLGERVAYYLDSFQGLNHVDIANRIIESGRGESVACYLNIFQGLNHVDIANKLIESGQGESVAENLGNFQGLPGDKILNLLEFAQPSDIKSHLFRFTDMPDETLAVLRKDLNMPELTNMPRSWADENGELHQPSASVADRWYGDLSYVYMEGGFNKATMGRLIRLRVENGLSNNIHDASQWFSSFRIPKTAYDIEAILRQRESDDLSPESIDGFSTTLIDYKAEAKFFTQLLSANQNLRNRLNYEGVQHELSPDDKLASVFSIKPELQNDFNQQLGRETGQLTESFYNELLNNLDIKQQYDEALANGTPRRKFFKDLFNNDSSLAADFDQRRYQMRNNIESGFYDLAITNHPELSGKFSKTNEGTNNESWFFDPINQLLFRTAMERIDGVPFYKQADFTIDTLFSHAVQMADNFRQSTAFGMGKDESSHNLSTEKIIEGLNSMREYKVLSAQSPSGNIGDTVYTLAQARLARGNYIKDTQSWLMRHATSPQDRLTKVWGDRALALANGESDNAKDVELWQTDNALRLKAAALDSTGKLQSGYKMSYDEVMGETSKPVRRELARRLSSEDIIDAMSKLKKWDNRREKNGIGSILPASSIPVEISDGSNTKTYKFDILDKKDPRGFTIGEDTYCCMTIDGVSKDCIKAGYTKDNCGFVAVYNSEGKMAAQSFWFINKEQPNVLVMDNIEANEGQDLQKVAEVYRRALTKYIKDYPETGINRVHVGTGYTDIDLGDMPKVDAVPTLDNVNYSDAEHQRLLLDIAEVRTQ